MVLWIRISGFVVLWVLALISLGFVGERSNTGVVPGIPKKKGSR